MRFYFESLGCPKNLVDSQEMARLLERLGHVPVREPQQAQVLVVNTCGFIQDARQESIRELKKLARRKRPDQVLIAAGCLSQRWGEALADQVRGLDALLGTRRWSEIGALVEEVWARRKDRLRYPLSRLGDPPVVGRMDGFLAARQGASAYLKIADGCSAPCAFCAIPLIKGPAHSRPVGSVVRDAVTLVGQGVKEIILIAQDTTAYGRDRGEVDGLPGLVQAILEAVPELHWLRLMYAYPTHVSSRLIELMAADRRVCHYLDLPLQHAHPDVLRRMKRPADLERTRQLIADLRAAMPDIALRTSLIVGYPGETEAEFEALLEFVSEVRFDRIGAFAYSVEEGTAAATLPNPVPEPVKAERLDRLMEMQRQISFEINHAQVGRRLDILVEGQGDGLIIGRSYRDAPEIDGLIIVPDKAPGIQVGEIIPVRITAALEYDLMGEREDR
ncbi:MAG: 30S ribosomal protein S12 methylthiotransferase RimO [Anaerolineae bacterium]